MYDWHSNTQWLIRCGGTTAHAFLLAKSDQILQARGSWNDSLDLVTVSQKSSGIWTTSDAILTAEARIAIIANRIVKNGLVEYLSSYHGAAMQQLELGLMHAASPAILASYTTLYQIYWLDLSLNYHPGSNSFGGSSGRSYDHVTGTHNIADGHDLPLTIQWAERPYCVLQTAQYSGLADGTVISNLTATALCDANSINVQPSSGTYVVVIERLLATSWQSAGHLYAPLDIMRNVILESPYRTIEQRFSAVPGQERYNFMTPYLQMGHSGEDFLSEPEPEREPSAVPANTVNIKRNYPGGADEEDLQVQTAIPEAAQHTDARSLQREVYKSLYNQELKDERQDAVEE